MAILSLDPWGYVIDRCHGTIITLDDVIAACQVSRKEAKRTLINATMNKHVQPVYRQIGSRGEWQFHLMALCQLDAYPQVVDVGFRRY